MISINPINSQTDSFGSSNKTRQKDFIDLGQKLTPQSDQSHILEDMDQMRPDKFLLVHMTDHMPKDGVIQSTKQATKDKDGVSQYRDTIHFALNHAVKEHDFGNWNAKDIAIIAPLDKTIECNPKENIVGGELQDFFIKKKVVLPKGSIIIRHNDSIPKGKLKVVNPESIDELKKTKGITVFETSESVHKAADEMVEMTGYTNIPKSANKAAGLSQEEAEILSDAQKYLEFIQKQPEKLFDLASAATRVKEQYLELGDKFKEFLSENNLNACHHTTSVYGRSEALIECIKMAAVNDNSWTYEIFNGFNEEDMNNDTEYYSKLLAYEKGVEKVDYKKEFLQVISEIKDKIDDDETLSYDIDKLAAIIEESPTPEDALAKIKENLKLVPMISLEECRQSEVKASSTQIFNTIDTLIGISDINKAQFLA